MNNSCAKLVLASVGALALHGCAMEGNMASLGSIQTKTIKLMVASGSLKVNELPTPGCPGTEEERKGCIIVAKNDTAVVTFDLATGGGWALTRMWICEGGTKPNPLSFCVLQSGQTSEFKALAGGSSTSPGTDGEIDLGGVSDFQLIDQNSFTQDYFYVIEACNAGTCVTSDPRIRNGGRL